MFALPRFNRCIDIRNKIDQIKYDERNDIGDVRIADRIISKNNGHRPRKPDAVHSYNQNLR